MKYCPLTGVEAKDSPVKKMCLNCVSLVETDPDTYACTNETVNKKGKEAILAAVPEGFEVETLTLKPMTLKNPTKKCSCYVANAEIIMKQFE